MQANFFSSESQKDLKSGSFFRHGDNVTWKALFQNIQVSQLRASRKAYDEKAVCALSIGQAKPGLLILVHRNTCLFCLTMSLKV